MLTARDAIEEHARHDDDRARLRRLYADFADAWNAVRSNITQWACHELHMPEFNDQSALSLCLVDPASQDEGSMYLLAALVWLAGKQAAFMRWRSATWRRCGRSSCSSPLHVCGD